MIASNVAPCVGMDFGGFELTPLGERRSRLPLQRKVKQLQRPWQSAGTEARVVPNRFRWASSQQRSKDSPVARPRSGAPTTMAVTRLGVGTGNNRTSSSLTLRRRPSTGPPQAPSRHQGKTHARPSDIPVSSKGPQQVVRWDGTAAASTSRGHATNTGAVRSINSSSYHRPSSGPRIKLAQKKSARVSGDATSKTLHSPLSSPSFFVPSLVTDSTVTDNGDATTDQKRKGSNAWWQTNVESKAATPKNLVATTANPSTDSNSPRGPTNGPASESAGSRPAVAIRRPSSASGSSVQSSLIHVNSTSTRPKTVGARNASRTPFAPVPSERFRDITGAGDNAHAEGQRVIRGTESGGDFSTSCEEESRGAGSSVGGRVSVSVVLPVLEKENDARDERFHPRSDTATSGALEKSAIGCSQKAGSGSGVAGTAAGGDKEPVMDSSRGEANVARRAAVLRMQSPYIGALGYYVGEDSGPSRLVAKSSLHGKALVGSHRCYTAGRSSKRPHTPAITPGEQPYGASHPLSPTSMGSPPRRHRNSNWGEEGTRLAEEEKENSRRTAPFIVSGTMLGWKLSTRGRKKSLEDSLKASDYSEHHLIPVYGFRCNDDYGGGTGEDKRRVELRRLEARALAAERTALERRAKAEGGAGGAAFARAMSRRALARAELVQKIGDVLDVRKENVCRGSSPEVIRAYRKHVRDRLHGERIRRRTARGLPARRPTRITAVTSRADLAGFDHPASDNGEGGNRSKAQAPLEDSSSAKEELGIEPYLLLVRAKHRQETARGGKAGGVSFCAGCLGGCEGPCSRS